MLRQSDDSDSDCLPNRAPFSSQSTIVRVRGPNHESTMNLNMSRSVMNRMQNYEKHNYGKQQNLDYDDLSYMHQNRDFEHQSFARSNHDFDRFSFMQGNHGHNQQRMMRQEFDQRSMHRHRETSPMSTRSVDVTSRMFRQPLPYNGFPHSSRMSVRETSPVSMRSIGSNVSATPSEFIVSAFQNMKFNKYEMKNIRDAYNKFVKGRIRKKISKRRNLKLFLKGARRKSGYDSGEQGSNSSLSSDDCRSTRTGFTLNKNYSRYMASFNKYPQSSKVSDDARSVRTDLMDMHGRMTDKAMFNDCTDTMRKDTFRNMFNLSNRNMSSFINTFNRANNTTAQNIMQKDRLRNNFLLSSQRFGSNRTVLPIPEEPVENVAKQRKNTKSNKNTKFVNDDDVCNDSNISSSDLDSSILKQPEPQRKRGVQTLDEIKVPHKKKTKLTPAKNNAKQKLDTNNKNVKDIEDNGFIFAKPQLPTRKACNAKSNTKVVPEITVDKIQDCDDHEKAEHLKEKPDNAKEHYPTRESVTEPIDKTTEMSQNDISNDISSRPSFMKRRLFTQTLDVTECKNASFSSSPANSSTHNEETMSYNDLTREKNRSRKLVTNQSCLSRDVGKDDNNLLDLIHKIVPANQLNATATVKENGVKINKKVKSTISDNKQKVTEQEKWDITSKVTNNDGNMSETFTDEEIFIVNDKRNKTVLTKENISNIVKKSAVVVERLQPKVAALPQISQKPPKNAQKTAGIKTLVTPKKTIHYAHTFWNCDSESESQDTPNKYFNNTIGKDSSTPKAQIHVSNGNHDATRKPKAISKNISITSSENKENVPEKTPARRGRPRKETVEASKKTDVSPIKKSTAKDKVSKTSANKRSPEKINSTITKNKIISKPANDLKKGTKISVFNNTVAQAGGNVLKYNTLNSNNNKVNRTICDVINVDLKSRRTLTTKKSTPIKGIAKRSSTKNTTIVKRQKLNESILSPNISDRSLRSRTLKVSGKRIGTFSCFNDNSFSSEVRRSQRLLSTSISPALTFFNKGKRK